MDYRVYDDLGNPQRIDFPEGITQPRNEARSQVVSGSYALSGTNEVFRYDLDGNREFHQRAGVERELIVDAADQLREVRRETDGALLEQLFYDGAGRRTAHLDVTSGVGTGYAYDALGRLTAVADSTGYELSLEYDPLGGRIRRTETQPSAASETTLFLSGLVELRGVDALGQSAEMVRWIPGPGPGGVVAEVSPGPSAQAPVIWSLLGDAAHNVVRMAQVTETAPGVFATTRATVRYAAFGLEIQATGSAPTGRRFAGMQSEGASGLVHMGARHYDPRVGAFLQPDPLGIAAVQTYAYAANNPYRFVDPSGLDPVSIADPFGGLLSSTLSSSSGFDSSFFGQSDMNRQPSQLSQSSDSLGRALNPLVTTEVALGLVPITAAGLTIAAVGLKATGLTVATTASAIGASPGALGLAIAPAGALLATATVGVAVAGVGIAGFGSENLIRIVNFQTGFMIPTPNDLLGVEIFPVLDLARAGGPFDPGSRPGRDQ